MANPATQEKAEKAYGARKAVETTALSSVPGFGNKYGLLADYGLKNNLSGPGMVGFEDTRDQAYGAVVGTGVSAGLTGLLKSPIAEPITTIGMGAINTYKTAKYAAEKYGVDFTPSQQNRRENALNTFRGGDSSKLSSITSTTPARSQYSTWEPASYGVGDYGSHRRGLLKS